MTVRFVTSNSRLPLPADEVRLSLCQLPEVAAQENLEAPKLEQVLVPGSHHKALSLDSTLVVGMRGAGKSLWTAVLSSSTHRQFVAQLARNPALGKAEVRIGFGLDESDKDFPSASTVLALHRSKTDSETIWKTVVLSHALGLVGRAAALPEGDWEQRCSWVVANRSLADSLLTECDNALAANNRVLLVLFDAMDRLGKDWMIVRDLIRGALQLALRCRARRALRLKFFLRPDMEEDAEIWRFPDSSKIQHSKVELTWKPTELYSLILTHLANQPQHGAAFRRALSEGLGIAWTEQAGVFPLPDDLESSDQKLRRVVEGICGEWMGRDKKRGFTYTWIPLHLADAFGRVSPRSFILAFKHAALAEHGGRGHTTALHYEGIQSGVAEASRIRIKEIGEDYPWVDPLLEAARGLFVPCSAEELYERWTSERIRRMQNSYSEKLPPRRFMTDPIRRGQREALVDDLIELAVLYRTENDRLNMPDIFRVGFGIKRRGGVKPLRT